MNNVHIRPIQPEDNPATAQMIRDVLIEQKAPKTGTAYEDPWLNKLYEYYDKPRSEYFVLSKNNQIVGGAGIAPISNHQDEITCELQKMYFKPEIRNLGLGTKTIQQCLDFAKDHNFTQCYIETLPWMKAAQKLYLRNGFETISERMGETGHHSCTVFMLKKL